MTDDLDKIVSIVAKLSQAADELKAMFPDEGLEHEIYRAINTVFDVGSEHGIDLLDI